MPESRATTRANRPATNGRRIVHFPIWNANLQGISDPALLDPPSTLCRRLRPCRLEVRIQTNAERGAVRARVPDQCLGGTSANWPTKAWSRPRSADLSPRLVSLDEIIAQLRCGSMKPNALKRPTVVHRAVSSDDDASVVNSTYTRFDFWTDLSDNSKRGGEQRSGCQFDFTKI